MAVTGVSLRRLGGAAVLLALILWNAWIAYTMATRLQMGDFRILYLSARAQLEGRDMYALPSEPLTYAGQPMLSTLVNLNPPHFQLLLLPVALVPAGVALGLWALASFLCLGGSLYVIVRELALEPSRYNLYRGSVWLLAFAGTGAVLGTGEVSFLLSLPLTLAWVAARRGRWNRAGLYLGLAMSLKLFLLVFIPYLLLRRRLAAAAVSGVAAAGCFAAGVLILGPGTYGTWLAQLASVHWAWRSPNASLLGILTRSFSENPHFTPVVVAPELILSLWLPAVATVGMVTLATVTLDRTSSAVDRAFALLLTAALLMSPLGWVYYLWLGLGPLAALTVDWRNERIGAAARWRQRLLVLAVPGLVWPHFGTFAFQPQAWPTPLLASAYFWSVSALWGAIVLDWWTIARGTCRPHVEGADILAGSPPIGEKDRPEERDQGTDRHVLRRPPPTHQEDAEHDHRAHDLGEGQRDQGIPPAESRPQHRHQLDIAAAHSAAAHDRDEQHDACACEHADRGLGQGRPADADRSQPQGVRQARQRDDIRDDPGPRIEDDDHRERGEQRQDLPPSRHRAQASEGQQGEGDREPRRTRERNGAGELGETAPYLVDGDLVGGCSGIRRGAG